jgi:hypothetical protein
MGLGTNVLGDLWVVFIPFFYTHCNRILVCGLGLTDVMEYLNIVF